MWSESVLSHLKMLIPSKWAHDHTLQMSGVAGGAAAGRPPIFTSGRQPGHLMTSRGAGPSRVRKGHDGQRPAPVGPYGPYKRHRARAIVPRDAGRVELGPAIDL